MTLTAIVICGVLTLIIILGVIYFCIDLCDKKSSVIAITVALIVIIGMWGCVYTYYQNTESGKRALKTQDSNFHNGIEREVTVYDINGNEIEHFQGKFDVDYSDERVMFDDEYGNRHIIYFKTGTVIINEVENDVH